MSIKKESAIQAITQDMKTFSTLTLEQLNHFMEIIEAGKVKLDKETLRTMEEIEDKLDKFEVKISDRVINTITLYNPIASDLRKVMSAYRLSDYLERIGDLTFSSVNHIQQIKSQEMFGKFTKLLEKMLSTSIEMVKRAIISYNYADKEYAVWVIENDERVDKLHQKLVERLVKKSDAEKDVKQLMMTFLSIRNIVSNIERIADQATNIAEAAIYSFEGIDVRHKKELPGDLL
jgi:phosphate transport system protein